MPITVGWSLSGAETGCPRPRLLLTALLCPATLQGKRNGEASFPMGHLPQQDLREDSYACTLGHGETPAGGWCMPPQHLPHPGTSQPPLASSHTGSLSLLPFGSVDLCRGPSGSHCACGGPDCPMQSSWFHGPAGTRASCGFCRQPCPSRKLRHWTSSSAGF